MNNRTIALPVELVDKAVNGYVQEQGHALNEIRELLTSFLSNQSAPADKGQGGPLSELEVLRASVKELEAMRDARVDAKLGRGHHVAYAENGVLHWMTGRKLQNCELYTHPAEQPAPVAVVMPELETAFEAWWESDGQYCRAGGGSYEKTFAYRAYEAALAEVARLNPEPKP